LERYDQARAELDLARETLSETSFWNGLAVVYELLGDLHIQCGRPDEALEVVEKRLQLARAHNNTRLEATAWEQKAHAHHVAGREAEALACLQRARQVAGRLPADEDRHICLQEVVNRPLFLRRTSIGD
jgi:tetratricopeptide (TPR) repeat protein